MKTTIYAIVAVGLMYACAPKEDNSPNAEIMGTWSWVKLTHKRQDTTYTWNNVSGQIIFAENHYAAIYVWKEGLRDATRPVPFDSLTLVELKNALSLATANTGTYSIEGDSIVFIREVALWPNAMQGADKRYTMPYPAKISNDTLVWAWPNNEAVWVRKY